jgi:hypothetical protein
MCAHLGHVWVGVVQDVARSAAECGGLHAEPDDSSSAGCGFTAAAWVSGRMGSLGHTGSDDGLWTQLNFGRAVWVTGLTTCGQCLLPDATGNAPHGPRQGEVCVVTRLLIEVLTHSSPSGGRREPLPTLSGELAWSWHELGTLEGHDLLGEGADPAPAEPEPPHFQQWCWDHAGLPRCPAVCARALRLTVLEYQGSDSARVAMRYAVHHVEASALAGLRGVGAVALAEEDDGDHGGSTGRRRRRALAAEQSGRWGFGFGPMRGALPWCEFVQQGIQGGDLFRRLTTELPVSRGCNRPPWPRSRC